MKDILEFLKFKHCIKNLIVFVPLIFSLSFYDTSLIIKAGLAFFAFCFISFGVYILNDIFDLEKDKLHPVKRLRPLACGRVSKKAAFFVSVLFIILSLAFGAPAGALTVLSIVSYFILNIFYTLKFKNQPMLDAAFIAFGFVLRILGGCASIMVPPSALVVLLTFFTSMFFTFSKRRLEFEILNGEEACRASISKLTEPLLNSFIVINATLSIAFYFTYMLDPQTIEKTGTKFLYITVIPFVLIIYRLLLLVYTTNSNDDPAEFIYKDKTLKILFLIYFITLFAVLAIKF